MKRLMTILATLTGLLAALFMTASPAAAQAGCALPEGASILMHNTLESGGEPEISYPAVFGLEDDALFDETATLAFGSVEFPTALAQPDTPFGPVSGLFSIDIEADGISQVILPEMDDPFWSQVFNTYPAGDFDRYYLTFSEPHGVTGATSDNVSASLRIDSDTTMVVEIGEGWEQVTGNAFELTFTCAAVAELAVTGASSILLAVMGGAAVLGGALILGQARRLHGVRA